MGSSSETILAKSVNDDEVQEGEVTASSEVDSAFDRFRSQVDRLSIRQPRPLNPLTRSQKTQRRKSAVSNVIAGSEVSVDDEVALQQSWELVGQAEPGYQHRKDDTKIDVNGTIVDVAQPGVVVADSVMVYIPPSRASFAAELGSIAGIDNIEPVFKNAKPSNIPGVRDPSGWQRIELSAPASRIKSIVRALKSFEGVTEAEPVMRGSSP